MYCLNWLLKNKGTNDRRMLDVSLCNVYLYLEWKKLYTSYIHVYKICFFPTEDEILSNQSSQWPLYTNISFVLPICILILPN